MNKSNSRVVKYKPAQYTDRIIFRAVDLHTVEFFQIGSLKPEFGGTASGTIVVRQVDDKFYAILAIQDLDDGLTREEMETLYLKMKQLEEDYPRIYSEYNELLGKTTRLLEPVVAKMLEPVASKTQTTKQTKARRKVPGR